MKLILSLLLCLITVSGVCAQQESQPTPSTDFSSKSIAELIQLLDAERFSEREAATMELVERGSRAVEPLALHALKASPESARRVKKCLEEIGTAGNESVFYQSVGILQVLFGSSNEKLNQEILRLQQQWDHKRTLQAIASLRSLGAKVITQTPQRFSQVAVQPAGSIKAFGKRKFRRLSKAQKERAVEEILNSSIDENRERVLGDNELLDPEEQKSEERKSIELLEMQLQRDPFQQGAFLINPGLNPNRNSGTNVNIGLDWTGNITDLKHLRKISDLSVLTFTAQKINDAVLNNLTRLNSLSTIEFEDCKFAKTVFAMMELPSGITTVRFRKQRIDVAIIDRLGDSTQLTTLGFGNCMFSKAALAKIHQIESLIRLEFADTTLDSDFLSRIRKMEGLRQLSLTSCKFPIPSYRVLRKQRPDLAIEFVPAAFLGVRSQAVGINDTRLGCKISEVIADTGADQGGLKIDDTIIEFDGEPIELFEDLRLHICQQRPGETVTLTIERDGETLEKQVTLSDYKDAPTR